MFEVSQAIVRNDTERSHAPFIQFPPMVAFCKTIVHHCNQEIQIDKDDSTRKFKLIKNIFITTKIPPVLL